MAQRLEYVFRFSESDYHANLDGRITDYQAARLWRELRTRMRWGVGLSWGLAVLMSIGLVYFLLNGQLSATWIVLTVGIMFVAVQVSLQAWDRWQYLKTDLGEGIPVRAEGPVWVYRVPPVPVWMPPRHMLLWFLVVDDAWLRAWPREADALMPGHHYRVFYTPRSRFILSISPLQPAQPDEHYPLTHQEA
ncbi:MAG: hypothetical protein ACLFTK_03670 [Anaerolineales bacterium]